MPGLVGQVGANREHGAVRTGGAEPLELANVETHLRHLGKLRHRHVWVGGQNREPVGLRHVVDMVGRIHVRGARHLPEDHRRVARDMLVDVMGDELRGDREAAGLGADHD